MKIYKNEKGQFVLQLTSDSKLKSNMIILNENIDIAQAIIRYKAYMDGSIEEAFYEGIKNNFKEN